MTKEGYFLNKLFPDLIDLWHEYNSVSKLLNEVYNREHIRLSIKVSARLVKEADARLLQAPMNYPILLAESINCDRDQTVIEYGVTRFCGDKMKLVILNE